MGDVIEIQANQRIPADCLLLYNKDGSVFIRTDQLDGETDWKLRKAINYTQKLGENPRSLIQNSATVIAGPPKLDIYDFEGVFNPNDNQGGKESLSLEQTLWANTVLASGKAFCLVIYTGKETRMAMNSSKP